MRKNLVEYTLILGANPRRLGEDWLVGSVIAHLVSCELNNKVFWNCSLRKRGILGGDKETFDELIDKIQRDELRVGEGYKNVKLSKYGYFYDGLEGKISWRFKIDKVFREKFLMKKNISKIDRAHLSFRSKYLGQGPPWHIWFLVSDIERLKNPLKRTNFSIYTYGKKQRLRLSDFEHNTVFICKWPKAETRKVERISSDDLLD